MFVFGVHVTDEAVFDLHCLPAIAAFGGPNATLITSRDTPIATTYNEMLQASLEIDDVEAVVLLRQDAEIADPLFLTKVRDAFARDPRLGILGPIGGSGITSLRWWQTLDRSGRVRVPGESGPAGPTRPGRAGVAGTNERYAVDCIDGLCMILRPQLAAHVCFDDVTFKGTSGYDVDYCFRVREEGFGVAVEPIDVVRHGPAPDDDAFHNAAAAWQGRRSRNLVAQTLRRSARPGSAHVGGIGPSPVGDAASSAGRGLLGSTPPAESGYDFAHPQLLAHLPTGIRRVLDVGCGSGALGAAVKAASGAHVTGIEYGVQAATLARERLDEVYELDLTTATDLPWEPEPFDVIILADVLSRLPDPEAVLRLLGPHLSDSGVVIATVPNVKHWSVLLPLLLEDRWESQTSGPLEHANLRFFTMAEATELFRRVGLGSFDACAAEKLTLADPGQLQPLLDAIGTYGADVDEAETLINAYQYVIVAHRNR
ncbi:MAG: glycosyltransferase [Micrococcales bacterium]|nr:glycosyltransferase [Micrococcales bacterium]